MKELKELLIDMALRLQSHWGHTQMWCQYKEEVLYCVCGWSEYADSLPDFIREPLYQEEPFLQAR